MEITFQKLELFRRLLGATSTSHVRQFPRNLDDHRKSCMLHWLAPRLGNSGRSFATPVRANLMECIDSSADMPPAMEIMFAIVLDRTVRAFTCTMGLVWFHWTSGRSAAHLGIMYVCLQEVVPLFRNGHNTESG